MHCDLSADVNRLLMHGLSISAEYLSVGGLRRFVIRQGEVGARPRPLLRLGPDVKVPTAA